MLSKTINWIANLLTNLVKIQKEKEQKLIDKLKKMEKNYIFLVLITGD